MEFMDYLLIALALVAIGFIIAFIRKYFSYDRSQEKVIKDDQENGWEVNKSFYLEGQSLKRGVLKKAGWAIVLLILVLLISLLL